MEFLAAVDGLFARLDRGTKKMHSPLERRDASAIVTRIAGPNVRNLRQGGVLRSRASDVSALRDHMGIPVDHSLW